MRVPLALVLLGLALLLAGPASATMAYVGTCTPTQLRCVSARVDVLPGGAWVSTCSGIVGCHMPGAAAPVPLPVPPPGRVDCDWFVVGGTQRIFVCQDLRET